MNKFTNEVLIAAKQVGCNASALTSAEGSQLLEDVRQKFSTGIKSAYFWETIKDKSSVQNKEAWSWIGDFIKEKPAIMLFADSKNDAGVEFEKGGCIVKTLWECTGFEFYLTNRETDYLICFNHHDFLIGVGEAQDWVKEQKSKQYAIA